MTRFEEHHIWLKVKEALKDRLHISEDKADDDVIDERIRGDIHMKGSNLWILMFAIFIASIGLNVNSTAVIIGAMLISPLMGPIMGIGYGAGINDFALIRRAFKNFAIATLIALITSTLYFSISPLDTAQSELLARTTPTRMGCINRAFWRISRNTGTHTKRKNQCYPRSSYRNGTHATTVYRRIWSCYRALELFFRSFLSLYDQFCFYCPIGISHRSCISYRREKIH